MSHLNGDIHNHDLKITTVNVFIQQIMPVKLGSL